MAELGRQQFGRGVMLVVDEPRPRTPEPPGEREQRVGWIGDVQHGDRSPSTQPRHSAGGADEATSGLEHLSGDARPFTSGSVAHDVDSVETLLAHRTLTTGGHHGHGISRLGQRRRLVPYPWVVGHGHVLDTQDDPRHTAILGPARYSMTVGKPPLRYDPSAASSASTMHDPKRPSERQVVVPSMHSMKWFSWRASGSCAET